MTMENILKQISKVSKLSEEEIRGKNRRQDIVAARVLFAEKASQKGYPQNAIGRFLGGKNHSSISHLMRKYKPCIYYYNFKEALEKYEKKVGYRH